MDKTILLSGQIYPKPTDPEHTNGSNKTFKKEEKKKKKTKVKRNVLLRIKL